MTSPRTISDTLSERTFRNLCGYMLFAASTIIPSIAYWQSGNDPLPAVNQLRMVDRPSRNHFGVRPSTPFRHSTTTLDVATWFWWLGRAFAASIGTTIAMVVLLPYSGCKRFAILFGPPTGLAAMMGSSLWLSGRTEIYRFEPAMAGIASAIPTGFLWILCCRSSWNRRVQREQDRPHEIVGDDLID